MLYLISATITNYNEHRSMVLRDTVFYLDTNAIVHLLPKSCHCFPTAPCHHKHYKVSFTYKMHEVK